MKIATCAMLLAGTLSITSRNLDAQVRAWQGTITLPTYEEDQPDPNPPFDTYADTEFNYPYTLRTSLTGVKQDHTWRAVFLENEYLKCTVLPDLGGHLYTCIDKIDGQPMFYANPSLKKAEIGHRGAWAAFGLEYNFPVSHNWASLSPVDFAYKSAPDGSASVSVGNIDRPYGMQWGVELVLRPGSTLLEERVTLFNRSDVRHRYYWWDNAGVQVWDDSRIEYPMRFVASHGFTDVYQWPVLKPGGKDLSLLKNHTDGPVSYFAHGSYETFMGVWHPRTNAGIAQFSEYRDLPAKKIWSWGSDADGLAWRTALSDNQSSYVEVQAGLFRNQETYAFLDPGQTIRFNEYWMPVRGTGGISRANKAGVIRLEAHGSEVSAILNVNERVPGALLSLTQGGSILWSGVDDLVPEDVWYRSVSLKDPSAKVTFELKDHAGRSLLKQTDGQYDWDPESTIKLGPQQAYQMPGPDARTEDDWLQLGSDQEVNGMVVRAMATYRQGLEKYPANLSLMVAAGRLAASLQRYAEAVPLLRAAQTRDTPNAMVAYYLGIAEEGLGHTREAQTAYDVAYRQAVLRAPAAKKLGEMEAQQGHLQSASILFKAASDAAPQDLLVREEMEALTRSSGDTVEADRLAHHALTANPTSDFLKEEVSTPDLPHLAADPYRVLRLATEYMELGLYQKALAVLSRNYPAVPTDLTEPGSVLPQNHPLIHYYAAYCKAKLGADAPQNWQSASQLSPSFVFPSTEMDHVVLEDALRANANDGTANYLLGTLLFSKGLYDAGIADWIEAKRLNPHLPVVDLDLGKAWLQLKANPQRALAFFREGAQNDPDNPEIYVGLDQAMSLTGVSAKERAATLSRYPQTDVPQSKMPANLVYQLALTRAEAGQFGPALSLFEDRFLASEEGAITKGQVLFEINLMQAEAEARTGQCAQAQSLVTGDLATLGSSRSSQVYFRMAQVERTCRNAQQSNALLRKTAAGESYADLPWRMEAEKLLGTYNADRSTERLLKSLPGAEHLTEIGSYSSLRWYTIGVTQAALHQGTAARESFRKSLLLPDSFMSHHLTRAALATFQP
jgi:tetratricopeptide (TPR) repeat protein